jgi:hypothetical protein
LKNYSKKSKFKKAKGDIFSDKYSGRDQLFLIESQINSFVKEEHIQNERDVFLLIKGLQPKEIETVCSKFKVQIAASIKSAGNLIILTMDLNSAQVKAFFLTMDKEINKIRFSSATLAQAINILSLESATLLFEHKKGTFRSIFTKIEDIRNFMIEIHKNKQEMVWNSIETRVVDCINASAFKEIFPFIPKERFFPFWESVKDKISEGINENNFSSVFLLLPNEVKSYFWKKIESKIVAKINVDNFRIIFPLVAKEAQEVLWEKAKDSVIKSTEKYMDGYSFLSIGLLAPTKEAQKDFFVKIFQKRNISAYQRIWHTISKEEQESFLDNVASNINGGNFKHIFPWVAKESQMPLWHRIKDKIALDINTDPVYNFKNIFLLIPKRFHLNTNEGRTGIFLATS